MNAKPAARLAASPATGIDLRLAASPDRSLWVNASAGTGKTNILTRRVLGLLLHGEAPQRILCLTFTKAAAAEMAQRIRAQLSRFALLPEPALAEALCEIVDSALVDATMIERARNLFAACLDVPDGLKIQTLHGFCQHVLQRFPIEAGLIPNFTIADDSNARAWQETALLEVLANPKAGVAEAVVILAEFCQDRAALLALLQQWQSQQQLRQRVADTHGDYNQMLAQAVAYLDITPPLTSAAYLAEMCNNPDWPSATLRAAAAALAAGSKTDRARAQRLHDFFALPADQRHNYFTTYQRAWLTAEGDIQKRLYTKAISDDNPEIASCLEAEAERVYRIRQQQKLRLLIAHSHAAWTLAEAWARAYAAQKALRHALDYQDLIDYTRRLLTRPGIAPWILYKLDGGVDHILIDEAQDTSPEQWEILRALTADFFTGESRPNRRATVFAVGDPKQSIYSFQGADPAGFMRMHSYYKTDANAARHDWRSLPLRLSYRSTTPILQLVDSVFTTTPAMHGVHQPLDEDGALLHLSIRPTAPGIVEIWPLPPETEKATLDPWQTPVGDVAGRNADEQLAAVIAAQIAQWLKTGATLPANAITQRPSRPIRAGDIMILVQRRNRLVHALTRALKRQHVPVSGLDRLQLGDHLAVMDVLALVRFCFLPDDDYSLACVLKSPLLPLPPAEVEGLIFALGHNRGSESLWCRLQHHAMTQPTSALAKAAAKLRDTRILAENLPAVEFFTAVLWQQGGRQALLNRLGSECLDPLDELINLATQQRALRPSLRQFVDWFDSTDLEIKRELSSHADQVRIMTVHAAKGLQAPIVFLPDTTYRGHGGRNQAQWLMAEGANFLLWPGSSDCIVGQAKTWQDRGAQKSLEEYRRLLYVALTRAEDRLYIATTGKIQSDSWFAYVRQAAHGMAQNAQAESMAYDFSPLGFPAWQGAGWRLALRDNADHLPVTVPPAPLLPVLPDWWHHPVLPTPVARAFVQPSRFGEAMPISPGAPENLNATRRGTIVHRLLQTLPDLSPEQRAPSTQRFLASLRPALSDGDQRALFDQVLALFSDPAIAPFLQSGMAEVPIIGTVNGMMVRGAIDRLVIDDGRIWLLDFKTTAAPPATQALTLARYGDQLGAYAALLRQIYPYHILQAGIIFTAIPRFTPLAVADLPAPA